MVIFHSYVSLPEGIHLYLDLLHHIASISMFGYEKKKTFATAMPRGHFLETASARPSCSACKPWEHEVIPPLVGGIPTPPKNMTSSVGMMTFPTEWKVIIQSCSKPPTRPYQAIIGLWKRRHSPLLAGWSSPFHGYQPAKNLKCSY